MLARPAVKIRHLLRAYFPMGSFPNHSSLIAHIFHMAALMFSVVKCVLFQTIRVRDMGFSASFNTPSYDDDDDDDDASIVSSQMIRDSLSLNTFENITERQPESCDRCAVCLNQLMKPDKVRMLRNCCHVFHGHCIDRWIDHDHLKTCPLCRAPLFTSSQSQGLSCVRSEPSWVVERLLYLFGDDLLT